MTNKSPQINYPDGLYVVKDKNPYIFHVQDEEPVSIMWSDGSCSVEPQEVDDILSHDIVKHGLPVARLTRYRLANTFEDGSPS